MERRRERHESACEREADLRELQAGPPARQIAGYLHQPPAQTAPGLRDEDTPCRVSLVLTFPPTSRRTSRCATSTASVRRWPCECASRLESSHSAGPRS